MKKFQVGDQVRVNVQKPMWYSGYGGRPAYTIRVGQTGKVVSIGIPPVWGPRTTNKIKVVFGTLLCSGEGVRETAIEQSYFPDELQLAKSG